MSYIKYFELIADLVSGRISKEEFERQTVNQKLFLENLIDSLLQKQITFKEFEKIYSEFVLDFTDGFFAARYSSFLTRFSRSLNGQVNSPQSTKNQSAGSIRMNLLPGFLKNFKNTKN